MAHADLDQNDNHALTSDFADVFRGEIVSINKRRTRLRELGMSDRPDIALEDEIREAARQLETAAKRLETGEKTTPQRPTAASEVVGLALSGGGIRSAAFCLGALQGLDQGNIIDRVDYMSSVSGGGYLATSISAAMTTVGDGKFPFPSELHQDEPVGIQHIRDHSNYLSPQGVQNIFCNVVVYLRGIVANILLVLPVLLIAAALTIYSNPRVDGLDRTNVVGINLNLPIKVPFFGVTLNLSVLFLLALAAWALLRSLPIRTNWTEIDGFCACFAISLIALIVIAFCELQPIALYGMFVSAEWLGGNDAYGEVVAWMKGLAAVLGPIATVVAFAGRLLANQLKKTSETPGFKAAMARLLMKAAIFIAAAALPLVLWVAYLYLSYWGIQNLAYKDGAKDAICMMQGGFCHTPVWLVKASKLVLGEISLSTLYLYLAIPALVLGWLLNPNANSLHRLYRDRLSKAFLFDPSRRANPGPVAGLMRHIHLRATTGRLNGRDLKPLDKFCIHEIKSDVAPYHLINAALNIEASKYANRRGRNADFFIFSPAYTGSEATQYVATELMEGRVKELNLATAMAISGAAASSNMGGETIQVLSPTLALLNVRLGYWLPNPVVVATGATKARFARLFDKLYLIKEMFGRLNEIGDIVYLTDGGHIENLGIYQLLRRRCKLIIAVDAEADPTMSFGSLIKLERYARIDLGTRIDLPWSAIRDATNGASKQVAETGGIAPQLARHGPHCALGKIHYPEGGEGILLYVKSSLTGDENDYIVDYKRRYPDFPHETTADQLFTEEQFEVYRALGFHAVSSALSGDDCVAMQPSAVQWRDDALALPLVQQTRGILRLSTA